MDVTCFGVAIVCDKQPPAFLFPLSLVIGAYAPQKAEKCAPHASTIVRQTCVRVLLGIHLVTKTKKRSAVDTKWHSAKVKDLKL